MVVVCKRGVARVPRGGGVILHMLILMGAVRGTRMLCDGRFVEVENNFERVLELLCEDGDDGNCHI